MTSRRDFVRQVGLAGVALSVRPLPAWALPPEWFAADEVVIPFTDVPADFSTKRGDTVVRFDLRELEIHHKDHDPRVSINAQIKQVGAVYYRKRIS